MYFNNLLCSSLCCLKATCHGNPQYLCMQVLGFSCTGPPGEPNGVIQGDSTGADFRPIGRDQRAVRLYWSDGARHGSDIISYTIQFRTNFDKRWRSHPQATRTQKYFVLARFHPPFNVLHPSKPTDCSAVCLTCLLLCVSPVCYCVLHLFVTVCFTCFILCASPVCFCVSPV